jgi:hypothetical protein
MLLLWRAGFLWAAGEAVNFSIPLYTVRVDGASGHSSSLVKKFASLSDKKISSVKSLLDSLGYFNASLDTVSDTIVIHPGKRSMVCGAAIRGAAPYSIDSIQKGLFPRFYDAGELRALANKTLRFMGGRGYPFARLSIDLVDTSSGGPVRGDASAQGIFVIFTVSENGRYAFAKPLLAGKTKTSARLLERDISIKKNVQFDLRKIEESQNRLLSRPYVASVETGSLKILKEEGAQSAPAALDSVKAAGFDGSVVVPFILSDNTGLGVDGAVAFQAGQAVSAGVTGLFNISLLNLFHYGETGTLTYRGERNYQRLEVSCAVPYLLGVPLFSSAAFGLEIQQNEYGYLHGELKLSVDVAPFWQGGIALNGHEATRYTTDTVAIGSAYEGLDFVLSRESRPYRAGELAKDAEFKIGSGLTQSSAVQLTRWHMDAGGGAHAPLGFRHAVVGRLVFGTMLTEARDTMQSVELYRTGGYNSVRGYTDNEFAFTTVLYGQAEYHYYFNYFGSVYLFTDFGAGRLNKSGDPQTSNAVQKMLGYGLGIRIPVKIGDAAIEWARNYKDTRSYGRLHISIRNAVAAGLPHS